jgi:hypothetical protein
MGWFDWFRKPTNVEIAGDRIWMNRQAKHAGLASELRQGLTDARVPFAILLVAHFEDCLDEVRSLAQSLGETSKPVLPISAGELGKAYSRFSAPGHVLTHPPDDRTTFLQLTVAERHPHPSHDQDLVDFARSAPFRCRIVHHVSLEDAVLRVFAGKWVEQVLGRLGMKEDEAIESPMVARRIQSAQKSIGQKATGDAPAKSAEEWFQKNCRELWRNIEE